MSDNAPTPPPPHVGSPQQALDILDRLRPAWLYNEKVPDPVAVVPTDPWNPAADQADQQAFHNLLLAAEALKVLAEARPGTPEAATYDAIRSEIAFDNRNYLHAGNTPASMPDVESWTNAKGTLTCDRDDLGPYFSNVLMGKSFHYNDGNADGRFTEEAYEAGQDVLHDCYRCTGPLTEAMGRHPTLATYLEHLQAGSAEKLGAEATEIGLQPCYDPATRERIESSGSADLRTPGSWLDVGLDRLGSNAHSRLDTPKGEQDHRYVDYESDGPSPVALPPSPPGPGWWDRIGAWMGGGDTERPGHGGAAASDAVPAAQPGWLDQTLSLAPGLPHANSVPAAGDGGSVGGPSGGDAGGGYAGGGYAGGDGGYSGGGE